MASFKLQQVGFRTGVQTRTQRSLASALPVGPFGPAKKNWWFTETGNLDIFWVLTLQKKKENFWDLCRPWISDLLSKSRRTKLPSTSCPESLRGSHVLSPSVAVGFTFGAAVEMLRSKTCTLQCSTGAQVLNPKHH